MGMMLHRHWQERQKKEAILKAKEAAKEPMPDGPIPLKKKPGRPRKVKHGVN